MGTEIERRRLLVNSCLKEKDGKTAASYCNRKWKLFYNENSKCRKSWEYPGFASMSTSKTNSPNFTDMRLFDSSVVYYEMVTPSEIITGLRLDYWTNCRNTTKDMIKCHSYLETLKRMILSCSQYYPDFPPSDYILFSIKKYEIW